MTTRWEGLIGDTSVFALKLAFLSDPDEGHGIDPEIGVSWGSFQIWVQGKNLCSHREEGEGIDSVHWYLLPLLEWFAHNWDPLFHEERLPVRNEGYAAWESLESTRFPPVTIEDDERKSSEWEYAWQAWWSRHALLATREGGLFPDIVFRRLRDRIELSWGPTAIAGMPAHYRFTGSERGIALLPPSLVAEPLHDVLLQAGEYLSKLMPDSGRIRALNQKLLGLKAVGGVVGEIREKRLAWLAGLGTTEDGIQAGWRQAVESLSDLSEQNRKNMLKTVETPLVINGSCHAAFMFGSLAPEVNASDVQELAHATASLYNAKGECRKMREVCRVAPIAESTSRPWEQGYDLAEEFYENLEPNFAMGVFVDVEKLIEKYEVRIGDLNLSDDHVRGVAIAGPQHKPGIFVNRHHVSNADDAGRRFTLAHEFCHLLFDREQGQALAVASGPWAPNAIEMRANAFAAMLLMPASLLKQALTSLKVEVASNEGVDAVARRLRVGRLPVLNHLRNLGFIDETERQRLLEGRLLPSA